MKIKYKITIVLIILIAIVIIPKGKVSAALQSNGGTAATNNLSDWVLKIRQMEEIGGTLGLTDTINTTDMTSSASTSNNLDIHMQKNTEYGALAILSASSYGNPNIITEGETTTGNNTGVVMNIKQEWVAAGTDYSAAVNILNSANRYKNIYSRDTSTAKIGDATIETNGWHGGSYNWNFARADEGCVRSNFKTIFSYVSSGPAGFTVYDAYTTHSWSSRAVIVNGNGI